MVLILIWRFCGFFVEQNNSVKPGNCYLANLLWQKKSSRSWASSLLQWIPNFSYGERWRPRLTFQNDTWVSLRRVTLAARRLQSRSTQCTSLQVGLMVGWWAWWPGGHHWWAHWRASRRVQQTPVGASVFKEAPSHFNRMSNWLASKHSTAQSFDQMAKDVGGGTKTAWARHKPKLEKIELNEDMIVTYIYKLKSKCG